MLHTSFRNYGRDISALLSLSPESSDYIFPKTDRLGFDI